MKISARVNLNPNESASHKAFADVTLDDCFVIKGVRIRDGKNGLFVAMPSKLVGSDYKEDCYPCTKEFRQKLSDAVLAAYNEKLAQKQEVQSDEQEEETQKRGESPAKAGESKQEMPPEESTAGNQEQKNIEPDAAQDESIGMTM